MNKETGGAAFPTTLDQVNGFRDGMTMRDYFAAKAMQAILSSPNLPMQIDDNKLAQSAYETADAMLEARK